VRKLVLFMHTSLDGFVAGPNGEMDWINVDDEMFEYAGQRTREADTALYGRITWGAGKEIVMFGSPTVAHALMAENLIDDYWTFVNPILLGQGIPLFKGIRDRTALRLVASHAFSSGVVCLHHELKV
jgi:dihydrofolate reductase